MTSYRQKFGTWGEQIAAAYLKMRGFSIQDRNVRTPYGEIDLVAQKADLLVFIEVKTRTSAQFGMPEDAINPKKREHLVACAEHYLQQQADFSGDWRIDVIAIRGKPGQPDPEILWFENALV